MQIEVITGKYFTISVRRLLGSQYIINCEKHVMFIRHEYSLALRKMKNILQIKNSAKET
jgi:hypothetical protein